jgi:hypothetical protein
MRVTVQRDGYLRVEAETKQDAICLLWWISKQPVQPQEASYPLLIIDTNTNEERAKIVAGNGT